MTVYEMGNKRLAARLLVMSAIAMLMGAGVIWFRLIPMADPLRTYLAAALGGAAIADLIIAVFFAKVLSRGDARSGRI